MNCESDFMEYISVSGDRNGKAIRYIYLQTIANSEFRSDREERLGE